MRSPDEVKKFMYWFNQALSEYPTSKEAYEATELTWEDEYEKSCYKSYESFKASKSYYMKNRLKSTA